MVAQIGSMFYTNNAHALLKCKKIDLNKNKKWMITIPQNKKAI